jgi:2-polyprenyl-6-methoxyphenol hydroxylase-like FAD-dependent oxidoreductase
MHSIPVLISGAGPTGLTLANILAQEGVTFRLIESDPGPIQQSRALWIHTRTMELWEKLGVLSDALQRGVKFTSVELMTSGQPAGPINIDLKGLSSHPYSLVLEQSKTQTMLLHALEEKHGQKPEWGVRLELIEAQGDHTICTLRHPDGTTETLKANYLIASDGSGSTIRKALGLSFEGTTYDSSFFLADVKMESVLKQDRLYVNLTKEGFFAFFPLYGDKQYRIIGSLDPAQTDYFERSRDVGAKGMISTQEVEDHINQKSGLKVKIFESRWASVYRIHRRMVDKYRVGNIFLAGDAAHVHSPAGGQGMNTGIGDAFNLGWKLAAVIKGQAKAHLLESYQAERLPVAQAVLNGSDKLFELETTTNPVLQQLKPTFVKLLSGIIRNFETGPRWLFSQLAQITIHYRDSPIVYNQPGHANRSKVAMAGDRLPYLEFSDQKHTHQLIEGVKHHLLLLKSESGQPLAALQQICERYDFRYSTLPSSEVAVLRKLGVQQPTLMLIRPDGHIAYRGLADDIKNLETYLASLYSAQSSIPQKSLVLA